MREITTSTPRKALSDAELMAPPTTTHISVKIMAERFGIETTEKFIRLAVAIEEKVTSGRADGDWSTMDSVALATTIIGQLPGFVGGVGLVDDELRNLSRGEIATLREMIASKVSEGVADIFEAVLLFGTGGLKITGNYLENI